MRLRTPGKEARARELQKETGPRPGRGTSRQPQHRQRDFKELPDSVQEGLRGRSDGQISPLAQKAFQAIKLTLKCKYLEARQGSHGAEMECPGMLSAQSRRAVIPWAPRVYGREKLHLVKLK